MLIRIAEIKRDPALQCREEVDRETAEEYGRLMAEGVTFPAVQLYDVNGGLYLVDGWHRLLGAELAQLDDIEATITIGTRREALAAALKANADHGLPRSNADKRRAILAALRDEEWCRLSNRELAKLCGVSHTAVNNERKRFNLPAGLRLTEEHQADVTGELPPHWEELARVKPWTRETLVKLRAARVWKDVLKALNPHSSITSKDLRGPIQERLDQICTFQAPCEWAEFTREDYARLDTVADLECAISCEGVPDRIELVQAWELAKQIARAKSHDRWLLKYAETIAVCANRPALERARQAKLLELRSVAERLEEEGVLKALAAGDTAACARLTVEEFQALSMRLFEDKPTVLKMLRTRGEELGLVAAHCQKPGCSGWVPVDGRQCRICWSSPADLRATQDRALKSVGQLLAAPGPRVAVPLPGRIVHLDHQVAELVQALAQHRALVRALLDVAPEDLREKVGAVLAEIEHDEALGIVDVDMETFPAACVACDAPAELHFRRYGGELVIVDPPNGCAACGDDLRAELDDETTVLLSDFTGLDEDGSEAA